jgi:hypothetical protein
MASAAGGLVAAVALAIIEYQFGGSQFTPQTGDWDGNGTDTPVLVDNNAETTSDWRLKNSNSAGNADLSFQYGGGEVLGPLAGDWNGDGKDTVGVGTSHGLGSTRAGDEIIGRLHRECPIDWAEVKRYWILGRDCCAKRDIARTKCPK